MEGLEQSQGGCGQGRPLHNPTHPLIGKGTGGVKALHSDIFPKDSRIHYLVFSLTTVLRSINTSHKYYLAHFKDKETEAGAGK